MKENIDSLFFLFFFKVDVNKSAGFHVHIGSDPFFTLEDLKRICANFVKFEHALDSLMPLSRRGVNNKYCRSHLHLFGRQNPDTINDVILSRNKVNGLLQVMNGGKNEKECRYFKLNLQRVKNRDSPTIEFRQHNGTSDFEKVRAWVLFLLYFVMNARQARPDSFAKDRNAGYMVIRGCI